MRQRRSETRRYYQAVLYTSRNKQDRRRRIKQGNRKSRKESAFLFFLVSRFSVLSPFIDGRRYYTIPK